MREMSLYDWATLIFVVVTVSVGFVYIGHIIFGIRRDRRKDRVWKRWQDR